MRRLECVCDVGCLRPLARVSAPPLPHTPPRAPALCQSSSPLHHHSPHIPPTTHHSPLPLGQRGRGSPNKGGGLGGCCRCDTQARGLINARVYVCECEGWETDKLCMYVCMCVCVCVCVCVYVLYIHTHVYVCMYVCMYVCVYVCVCLHVFWDTPAQDAPLPVTTHHSPLTTHTTRPERPWQSEQRRWVVCLCVCGCSRRLEFMVRLWLRLGLGVTVLGLGG